MFLSKGVTFLGAMEGKSRPHQKLAVPVLRRVIRRFYFDAVDRWVLDAFVSVVGRPCFSFGNLSDGTVKTTKRNAHQQDFRPHGGDYGFGGGDLAIRHPEVCWKRSDR